MRVVAYPEHCCSRLAISWRPVLVPFTALLFLILSPASQAAQPAHVRAPNSITATVNPDGSFEIISTRPAFRFGGTVGVPLNSLLTALGRDGAGLFQKVSFEYSLNGIATASSIRIYHHRPAVVFSTTLLASANNGPLFPTISAYPQGMYKFRFANTYQYQYGPLGQGADSPWAYFDSEGNTFIVSPASHFPIAATTLDQKNSIVAGINAAIPALPAGFTQETMLVVGSGINHTWDLWGKALTDLQGKVRPGSESDVSLAALSYWTDSASKYYYYFEPALGYEGTLEGVKQDFAAHGIPVRSMQLDSWWYPKGIPPAWSNNGDGIVYGEYELRPDPSILPDGLAGVRKLLGIPLLVHARWLEPDSPIRMQYQVSGNVAIDPRYWTDLASYLASSGVMTYEQDWLAGYAQPAFNLTDPEAYLDNMARAMAAAGITMQYCGQDVGQLLQGSKYGNLTTARVSGDGFNRSHWDPFLYNSRLTSALGIFPFSDNVYSADVMSLVVATNSAGIVGLADAIGSEAADSILQAIRPDGIIVKPDAPMVPLDSTYVADAGAALNEAAQPPMVAFSYTDHGALRTAYVFAYSRAPQGGPSQIEFAPADVGIKGDTYVYDYFAHRGRLLSAGSVFTDSVPSNGSYFVVAPVGPSRIALVGDTAKFVAAGAQRIGRLEDDGVVNISLEFAPAETGTTIWGYSPSAPVVNAIRNGTSAVNYFPASQVFFITIRPEASAQEVSLTLSR